MSNTVGIIHEDIDALKKSKVALQDDIISLREEKASLVSEIQKLKAEAEALGQLLGATTAEAASTNGESEFAESSSSARRVSTDAEALKQTLPFSSPAKAGNHPGRQWGSPAPPLDSWWMSIDDSMCPLLEIEPRNISRENQQVAAAFTSDSVSIQGDIGTGNPPSRAAEGNEEAETPDNDRLSTPTKKNRPEIFISEVENSTNGNEHVGASGDILSRDNLENAADGRLQAKHKADSRKDRGNVSGDEVSSPGPIEENCLDGTLDCHHQNPTGEAQDDSGAHGEVSSPGPPDRETQQMAADDEQESQMIINSIDGGNPADSFEPVQFDEAIKGLGLERKESAVSGALTVELPNRVSSPERFEPQHQQINEQQENSAAKPSSVDFQDGHTQKNITAAPSTAVSPQNGKIQPGKIVTEDSPNMITPLKRNQPACTTTLALSPHQHVDQASRVENSKASNSSRTTTTRNHGVTAPTPDVSEQEKEIRKQKERFLMFTRVLMKYLESKDPPMHAKVKAIIKECAERNKRQEPGYESVTGSMRERLKQVVGDAYWKRAEAYLAHFLAQKQRGLIPAVATNQALPSRPTARSPPRFLAQKQRKVDLKEKRKGMATQRQKRKRQRRIVQRVSRPQESQQQRVEEQVETTGNHGATEPTGKVTEEELRKQKERFLMFTRVLMKYLESKDPPMHAKVKAIIKECAERNKRQEPGYESVTGSMRERLKQVVGDAYWKRAEAYLAHFLAQKQRAGGSSSSSRRKKTGNGCNPALPSRPAAKSPREINNAVTQNSIQNSIQKPIAGEAGENAKKSSRKVPCETESDSGASDSEEEEEVRRELSGFLNFVEFLAKCLESKDWVLGHRVREILKDCTEKNRLGVPGYESLEDTIREQLKRVVEFSHWANAEGLFAGSNKSGSSTSDDEDDDDDDTGSTHCSQAAAPERDGHAAFATGPRAPPRPIAATARRTSSGSKQITRLISTGKRRLLSDDRKQGTKKSKHSVCGVAAS